MGVRIAPPFFAFLTVTAVSALGYPIEFPPTHRQCDTDHQCDEGFFCYEESHFCTRCVECSSYKRSTPSWLICPKTPSNCGTCVTGYQEEILHEGRTRDMCVPSYPNTLSHTIVPDYSSTERYLWAVGITAIFLPIVYYAFCRRNEIRDRGAMNRGVRCEDPPPYRSIELTTLSSNNNSEERLSEEGHVMCVGQLKDQLTQAIPFRKPEYLETELLTFDNNVQDGSPEDTQYPVDGGVVSAVSVSNIDIHDESTMPSDWTPENNGGQLMSFEVGDISETEETCEPVAKRHKTSESQDDPEDTTTASNTHNLSINLFINNNVTIHKPS